MTVHAWFQRFMKNSSETSKIEDWKYKQWLRVVTVTALVLIFLVWGGVLSMVIILSTQLPSSLDSIAVCVLAISDSVLISLAVVVFKECYSYISEETEYCYSLWYQWKWYDTYSFQLHYSLAGLEYIDFLSIIMTS